MFLPIFFRTSMANCSRRRSIGLKGWSCLGNLWKRQNDPVWHYKFHGVILGSTTKTELHPYVFFFHALSFSQVSVSVIRISKSGFAVVLNTILILHRQIVPTHTELWFQETSHVIARCRYTARPWQDATVHFFKHLIPFVSGKKNMQEIHEPKNHNNSQAEFWRVTSHPTKIEDKKELIYVPSGKLT